MLVILYRSPIGSWLTLSKIYHIVLGECSKCVIYPFILIDAMN